VNLHDPGPESAAKRAAAEGAEAGAGQAAARPIIKNGSEIRVGTASWTDKTMTAKGVFYPASAKTPEDRLRYYASRFPLVEADMGFYAIPDRTVTERWVERTPDDFVFNLKAHALMTGHATEVARLPRAIRDHIPESLGARIYAKDLPAELRDEVWRHFRLAAEPLHEAGKLGAILLQFAPWIQPNRKTPAMLARVREQMGDLPVAIEFRHPSWMRPRVRERVWDELRELGMIYVIPDTPPDTPTSMPIAPAITNPELAIVRLHGRRSELWGAKDAVVVEKYRYLYDANELEEWLSLILELAEEAERIHIVFNNCYANYGTTNDFEMERILNDGSASDRVKDRSP
jgi:uncharacterized protein YecE (DUF72 family)